MDALAGIMIDAVKWQIRRDNLHLNLKEGGSPSSHCAWRRSDLDAVTLAGRLAAYTLKNRK